MLRSASPIVWRLCRCSKGFVFKVKGFTDELTFNGRKIRVNRRVKMLKREIRRKIALIDTIGFDFGAGYFPIVLTMSEMLKSKKIIK